MDRGQGRKRKRKKNAPWDHTRTGYQEDGKYRSKVKSHHYLAVYQLARQGLSKEAMARELKVSKNSLNHWLKTNDEIRQSYLSGRSEFRGADFISYAFKHLPPDLQRVWNRMCELSEEKDDEALFYYLQDRKLCKKDRQWLFMHCLITTHFNVAEACRRTGTPYACWMEWREDPKFQKLCRTLHDMKKDYIESALMGLVSSGDSAAIIFANKTLNADRGYGVKKQVEVSGTVGHAHYDLEQVVDLLDLKDRKRVLQRMRENALAQKGQLALPAHIEEDEKMLIEDAEFTIKEKEKKDANQE